MKTFVVPASELTAKSLRARDYAPYPRARTVRVTRTYQISTDGVTVWVNGKDGCVARFGAYAGEITLAGGRPLLIIALPPDMRSTQWNLFVEKVEAVYGVKIPEAFMPKELVDGRAKTTAHG